MKRLLLIGAGRIGRIHAENIARSARASLAAVCDADPNAAHELAARWGCAAIAPEEALYSVDADAVLIASSTDTHAEWIERSALAGKAVFCEKPLDLDIRGANNCLR